MNLDFQVVLKPLQGTAGVIFLYIIIALIVIRFSNQIAERLRPIGDLTMRGTPRHLTRMQTIQAIIASTIRFLAVVFAVLFSLSRFVSAETLVWMVGLFSAAFGLGARPYIADLLGGVMLMFEDTYDVGDKIEFPLMPQRVEGVVEEVNLRVTRVRGMDGELYTMPNGDVRLVRNFSRGSYSIATVKLTIPAKKVKATLEHLESLNETAMTRLPNLIEPWQVISESGELGENPEFTVIAKARFGKGADLRTHLLALLQEELDHIHVVEQDEAQ